MIVHDEYFFFSLCSALLLSTASCILCARAAWGAVLYTLFIGQYRTPTICLFIYLFIFSKLEKLITTMV